MEFYHPKKYIKHEKVEHAKIAKQSSFRATDQKHVEWQTFQKDENMREHFYVCLAVGYVLKLGYINFNRHFPSCYTFPLNTRIMAQFWASWI